jgi:hypothetical protein
MLGRLKGGGDGVDARGKHAIGSAEHGVLLVDGGGDPAQPRRHQGGKRRIAAEAHHRARPYLAQELEGGNDAPQQHRAGPRGSQEGSLRQGCGGNTVDGSGRKIGSVAIAALVRHEVDADGAPPQFLGQGQGGKEVSPRPAGCQHHRASAHDLCDSDWRFTRKASTRISAF